MHKRDTAAGPDGISYAAWRAASPPAKHVLYLLYLYTMSEEALDEELNFCRCAFLPKGAVTHGGQEERPPKDTRLLPLSNTDNKIICSALAQPLNAVAAEVVDPIQKGFIKGRSLVDNIVLFDGHLLGWAGALGQVNAGGCLFDFAQAFLSVFHRWICRVLGKMGLPNKILTAIKELYANVFMYIGPAGPNAIRFLATRGMKQGCPLSGVLFALILDPVLRCIKVSQAGLEVCLTAFADDIAVACNNMLVSFPAVLRLLVQSGCYTGLSLNISKCILLMINHANIEHVIQMFMEVKVKIKKF